MYIYIYVYRYRIAAAWAAFAQMKPELCKNSCPKKTRVKLFEAVVTPRVMYGAGTWTMNRKLERQLQSTRRSMLRMMFGGRRRPLNGELEPWVEYVQRATRRAEEIAVNHGAKNWVVLQRHQKWRLAGKIATAVDGRWTKRLLDWAPSHGCGRPVGRPFKTWAADIEGLAGGNWIEIAQDADLWNILEDAYANRE